MLFVGFDLRVYLKGQCHEIFCFRFFSWIIFPQAPDFNIRIILNFFENSRRYSQVKVHYRCQRHRWQIAAGINDTGGKFRHQFPLCCWHRWQICHQCQQIFRWCQRRRWQIAIGINNTGGKFATGVIDAGGKYWEQYQAADTWKWTWRQKFIYKFPLLPKGDQTKLLKFYWLKIFSICHRCRWHRWQILSCEYLREFSKKFEMVLMEYSGAGGKLIHEKNQKQKISWHCPFNLRSFEFYLTLGRPLILYVHIAQTHSSLCSTTQMADGYWRMIPLIHWMVITRNTNNL